ncbi:head-tail connector protein [Erythrobacter sp.]|jgi:uncharacterized phiE125 gp8 family phage protein|uniref:head-tail connector protein n=1 Tax=Erythrobacter sp. TaxID=1042 RepID=UPI002EB94DAB|nr:phage head-tail connector protein [Erythrobacter sp.]
MLRRIVEPADAGSTALAELKAWLGITRDAEDDLLAQLLQSSVAMCEAFIGRAPLSQLVEERVPVIAGSYTLKSRPVASFSIAETVAQSGIRNAVDPGLFEAEIRTDGRLDFRLLREVEGQAVAVRVRVGIAGSWDEIPTPLRQGIIRLCAYYYRDRDRTVGSKLSAPPPASVSALWQPWREMRLA